MQDVLKLIKARKSLRISFDAKRPVAKEDLVKILEAGRWAPTAHNMQNYEIVIVDDKKILENIGKIKSPISEIFVRENYKQLSFSEEELRRKKVGISGAMFPLSWRNPDFKLSEAEKKAVWPLDKSFPTGPVLLIVVYDPDKRAPASEGDFLGIISLGCVMENMWLMANSLGIGFHIMSVLGADPVAKEVKRILDIPKQLKIAFACRLGYPVSEPAKYLRVRRDVEDFTHHNRFGNKGLDSQEFRKGLRN
ncbi:MAG: nitroreductase family protein [Chloroflexi bacterium]|nr:nitroreductase family protein [Chloroflexota bacterium]